MAFKSYTRCNVYPAAVPLVSTHLFTVTGQDALLLAFTFFYSSAVDKKFPSGR